MNINIGQRIEKFLDRREWEKARTIILRELKQSPLDHWLITCLSTTYYEEHKYTKAIEISQKALKLAPRCPIVLWDYAGALDMVGKDKKAIAIWEKLLKRGVNNIAYGECGEGKRRARSILNDSRYRIGLSYCDLGNIPKAKKYINEHLKYRTPGIPSLYTLREVKKALNTIDLYKKDRLRKKSIAS
jgi:tetratricopeptide (TPR) repeat protein